MTTIPKDRAYYRPAFIRKVDVAEVKRIEASYSSQEEYVQDSKGYFVVKVFYDEGFFGARHHTMDHKPTVDIVGTDAQEIVQTIVREGLVGSLQHAAYLGLELEKAEVALQQRLNYVQCSPLDFSQKTAKKESDNLPE